MSDKSKTTTTLSFRCPADILEAIDSIGRQHYPTDKNSKTNSGCDRSTALFHIIQAGIAALTDGNLKIEVRQSKTDSNTGVSQGELEEIVKKLIGENLPVIQPRLTDDNSYVKRCELNQKIDDRIVKALGEDGLFFDSAANDLTKQAIAQSYSQATTNLNSTRDEFYSKVDALQKQFEELKSNPPAAVPTVPSPQSPITNNQSSEKIDPLIVPNHQLPKTPEEMIRFLGIEDILGGEEYWQEQLEVKGIDTKIKDNFEYFKSLGIEFKGVRDTAVSRFNLVLKWLGYKGEQQKTTIKQSSGVGVNKYIAVKVAQNDN